MQYYLISFPKYNDQAEVNASNSTSIKDFEESFKNIFPKDLIDNFYEKPHKTAQIFFDRSYNNQLFDWMVEDYKDCIIFNKNNEYVIFEIVLPFRIVYSFDEFIRYVSPYRNLPEHLVEKYKPILEENCIGIIKIGPDSDDTLKEMLYIFNFKNVVFNENVRFLGDLYYGEFSPIQD